MLRCWDGVDLYLTWCCYVFERNKHRRVGHPCPTHSAFIYSCLGFDFTSAQPSFSVGWVGIAGMLYPPTVSLFPSHNPSNHTPPLPAGEGQGVGLCGFLYGAFFVLFPKRLLLPSKTTPFTFQKDSFCLPKRPLLPSKRTPFAIQNEPFCNPKGLLFGKC